MFKPLSKDFLKKLSKQLAFTQYLMKKIKNSPWKFKDYVKKISLLNYIDEKNFHQNYRKYNSGTSY